MPNHYDYKSYRLTPDELKIKYRKLGWNKIIGFQTRNPLHKAHVEMTLKSMEDFGANLLLHLLLDKLRLEI